MNDYKSIIEKIYDFEKLNDLKNLSYDGIEIWPLIKCQIAIKYFNNLDTNVTDLGNYSKRVFEKVKLFIGRDIFKTIFKVIFVREEKISFEKKDFLFFSDESSKRIEYQKKWIDIFIDPVIEKKSLSSEQFYILRSNQNNMKTKKSINSEIDLSAMLIRSFIRSRLNFNQNKSERNKLETEYQKLEEFFADEKELFMVPRFNDIFKEVLLIKEISKSFEQILKRIQPKQIYMSHYLGYVTTALCFAAKNKKIETFDIQHGVQGNLHPAYNFRNFPEDSFSTMPDKFLVWNEEDANNIDKWSFKNDIKRSIIFGNPIKLYFSSNNSVAKHYDDIFESIFNKFSTRKLILVSLCWTYFIPETILKVIKEAPLDYYFLIRFHPVTSEYEKKEVIRRLRLLNKDNFEIENSTKLPLHTILKKVSSHLAIVSTVISEGLDYNLKTIAISSRAEAYWRNNESKKLFFSDCAEEILNILQNE